MFEKDAMIKVVNKYNGTVGYDVQDLNVHRDFYPGESKDIRFEELERLSFTPGGAIILRDFLEIVNPEVAAYLLHEEPEPEYFYSKEDIEKLMKTGSLDQFLDCLDFAPESVKELIKDIAVEMPLNDVEKRQAILEKLNFDVSKAIEIKNTKNDGDDGTGYGRLESGRRVPTPTAAKKAAPTGRRYKPTTKE